MSFMAITAPAQRTPQFLAEAYCLDASVRPFFFTLAYSGFHSALPQVNLFLNIGRLNAQRDKIQMSILS